MHIISGFIAKAEQLLTVARELPNVSVYPLSDGFGFLPVMEDVESSDEPIFGSYLTARTADWAREKSVRFPIVYIETEYFGGAGGQGAIVWRGGKMAFGPVWTGEGVALLDLAINCAVRQLGVMRGGSLDEFACLGLGAHRSNEDWRESVRL